MSNNEPLWALILGSSSGIGLATAQKLAQEGYNIFAVHRDRRGSMARINAAFDAIRNDHGVSLVAFNENAVSPEGRQNILNGISDHLGEGRIKVVLHSIALGNLKPAAPDLNNPGDTSQLLNEEDFAITINNMGYNLLFWTQDLCKRSMFASDARVIGLTSEGNLKAWQGYAAVAAAKCTLESVCRAMAKEFAPFGIRCNVVQAGVTETPALKLIPGNDSMLESARQRNPFGRTTTPEDVAGVISLLCREEAKWINGSLIHADGGEHICDT